jgi:hypothetical protein
MSTVKLNLRNKSVPEKIDMGNNIGTALGDPAPAPYTALAATLKSATATLQTKNNESAVADAAAVIATGAVELAESDFGSGFGALAREVQTTTNGVRSGIIAAGFEVRADANPVTSLDYVGNFGVTTTNTAGVLDFSWDRSKGARNFEIRGRKATDPAGTYSFMKSTSKTRVRAGGFERGVDYIFEIRAYGAGEMVPPWCDPFTKKAS